MRRARHLFVIPFLFCMSACAKDCARDRVAMGIARLTVRNADAMAKAAAVDTECGFSAPAVLGSPTIEGEVGRPGSVTWSVEDCTIAFDGTEVFSENCHGVTRTLNGSFTITGTKKVSGLLTGDPFNPVIPQTPDAVNITLSATFNEFEVLEVDPEDEEEPAVLVMHNGGIAGTMMPRLAAAAGTGLCTEATDHTQFFRVAYDDPSNITIKRGTELLDVEVTGSDLAGMYGEKGDSKNEIFGTLAVWGSVNEIPIAGDEDGLDDSYELEDFNAGFMCDLPVVEPLSFECGDPVNLLADNSARLSANTFATVVGLIADDDVCGFSSMAAAGTASLVPDPVNAGQGSITLTVSNCELDFPVETWIGTDCNFTQTFAEGSVTVSGTQTVSGFLTGDLAVPIAPTTDAPAVLDLSMSFDNFRVSASDSEQAFTNISGSLAGTMIPRTALSVDGVCSAQTATVRFQDLTYDNGVAAIESSLGNFGVTIDASDFDASSGNWDGVINTLAGVMTINGKEYAVPADGLGLDPGFDQTASDATWQCNPELIMPVSFDCLAPMAHNAARALVKVVGVATSLLDANDVCGFSAPAIVGAPTDVSCAPPCVGSITWATDTCAAWNTPTEFSVSTNCLGTQTYVGGAATATSEKTVAGQLTGANPPVVPGTRDAALLTHSNLTLADFVVYDEPAGGSAAQVFTFSGVASGAVGPITGESIANLGVYSIATPVVDFTGITIAGGLLVLESGGKTLYVTMGAAEIDAFAGAYGGVTNSLNGTVTIEGETFDLVDIPLDPAFTQVAFDSSYSCHPDLVETIPPN